MKALLSLVLIIAAVSAFGKDAPVTRSEAASVFAKTDKAMNSVLHFRKAPAPFTAGAGVASRGLILEHLYAVYEASVPLFKFTAPPFKSAPDVLAFKGAEKNLALKMEVLGFIDRYGPLATSKADGLTPREFGDTVGYFMARIAELTHTPSAKYSPYLAPG
ncbi:MAG TPA: hypothetical protein VMI31_14445 [Fimbriimonadaceae bacterium]|nr:hypothetical protein [Fimbriimonadaceae bacterium]